MGKLSGLMGALKGSGAAKGIGSVAGGALGKAAGGVGSAVSAGGSAISGAGFAAGATAIKETTGALRTVSFLMIIFFVWWYVFGSSGESTFLMYYGTFSALFYIVPLIFTKGQAIKPELYGLLPVFFLFMDVGLVSFIAKEFGLTSTPVLKNLVLFMPWWAFFGLMTLPTKKEGPGAFLINTAKIVGILYIIFTILIPSMPSVAYAQDGVLPTMTEFEKTQADARAELGKNSANPAVLNWKCFIEGRYTDLPQCVEEKKEIAEIEYICEHEERYKPGTTSYKKCVVKQQEERNKGITQISGSIDPTIKMPTTAKLVVSDYFPKKTFQVGGKTTAKFPIELEIKNPRKQEGIEVIITCNFVNNRIRDGNYLGKVSGGNSDDPAVLSINGELEISRSFICEPELPNDEYLNGSYEINYNATFINLVTKSRLQRAFIGDEKDEVWKKEWIPKIMKAHFSGSNAKSQAPADFARMNFAFGNPIEKPIIEGSTGMLLSSNIENVGSGTILEVSKYNIDLSGDEPADLLGVKPECVGSTTPVKGSSKYNKIIYLPTCVIKTVPDNLKNPPNYIFKEYEAEITYDYQINKKVNMEIVVVEG